MKKIILIFILSTIFCFGQNIVDDVSVKEDGGTLWPVNFFDDGGDIHIFNWLKYGEHTPLFKFSQVIIDDNLNLKLNFHRDFVTTDYSSIMKYNNGFLMTEINQNGGVRLIYFEEDSIEVLLDYNNSRKFRSSFFFNDKLFLTKNDLLLRDSDSLRLCFYKANLEGEILDSIIYSDFDPKRGLNFNYLYHKPLIDGNGNIYILGIQSNFLQPLNSYIIKFNKNEELEFVKFIERQPDNILAQPNNIICYLDDKFIVYGSERDTKNSIIYGFIKVFDSDFNELSHNRYAIDRNNQFASIIVNKDSTLTVYGKHADTLSSNHFYASQLILDKNLEEISFKKFESDSVNYGFHFAFSRDYFDIVVGYKGEDLYIAKIGKHNLSVKRNLEKLNALYIRESNELVFSEEIPQKVEIIDLLGRSIFIVNDIKSKNVILPILPENQAIFAKIKYNSAEILQRIK